MKPFELHGRFQSPAKPFEAVKGRLDEQPKKGFMLIISTTNFRNVLHYHNALRKVRVCNAPLRYKWGGASGSAQ